MTAVQKSRLARRTTRKRRSDNIREPGDWNLATLSRVCHGVMLDEKWLLSEQVPAIALMKWSCSAPRRLSVSS